MIKKIFYFAFVLLLLILVVRSFQFIYRIYTEFRFPEPDRIKAIDVCQNNPRFTSVESEWLFKYLKIGTICEK